MLGLYIANTIMKAKRMTYKICEDWDRKCGLNECFDEYYNVWKRTEFELPVKDAVIHGEYIINPADSGPRKKVALICHGLTSTLMADCKYGTIFYKLGYSLVFFDERYYGKSTGKYCTLGYREKDDAKALLKFVRSIFGEDAFIGLHGESMGAAVSLLVLDTEKPDFVVADCPFSDSQMLLKELVGSKVGFLAPPGIRSALRICKRRDGYDFTKVNPIDSVEVSDVPICFMHGDADQIIGCHHSRRMFEKCKNPLSEIHIWEGAAHAFSIVTHKDEYTETMSAFIKKTEKEKY